MEIKLVFLKVVKVLLHLQEALEGLHRGLGMKNWGKGRGWG